jgi:hypothetical protein
VTAADFRRIALNMPKAVEGSHFGNTESEGYRVVLLLTPQQQAGMVEDEPKVFSPVPGDWGRKGATRVRLAKVALDLLEGGLRGAWRSKAPKRRLRAGSAT